MAIAQRFVLTNASRANKMIMHICIAPKPRIRGAILALTAVHSADVNYLGDDATAISSFTLSKKGSLSCNAESVTHYTKSW